MTEKDKLIKKHKGNIIFKIVFILLWFVPLIPMFASKAYDMPYLLIPSLILYTLIIISGLFSYTDFMFKRVMESGKYHKDSIDFSLNIYLRIISTLLVSFSFIYLGYDIYGFLFLISSGGEYYINNKIEKKLNKKKKS